MSANRVVALLVSLVAACSSGGSSVIPESQFGTDLAAALCAKALQCCAGQSGNPTQASCVAYYGALEQQFTDTQVATGHVTYSSSNAAACTADISNAPCTDLFFGVPASCNAVLSGTQANGAACQYGVECRSTLCLNETGAGTSGETPGTCAAQGAIGQACAMPASLDTWVDNEQLSGSLCAAGSYPSTEINGTGSGEPPCTCIALTATGAACPADGSQGCASGYCDSTGHCSSAIPTGMLDAQQCSSFFNPD